MNEKHVFVDFDDAFANRHAVLHTLARIVGHYSVRPNHWPKLMRSGIDLAKYIPSKDLYHVWHAVHDVPIEVIDRAADRMKVGVSNSYKKTLEMLAEEDSGIPITAHLNTRNDEYFINRLLERKDYFSKELKKIEQETGVVSTLSPEYLLANFYFVPREKFEEVRDQGLILNEDNKLEVLANAHGDKPHLLDKDGKLIYIAPPDEPIGEHDKIRVVPMVDYPKSWSYLWKAGF